MIYIFILFANLWPVIYASTITLTDATSNDYKYASTNYCQDNYGGPCTAYEPITKTQDESVTDWWTSNEPFACAYIFNTNEPQKWTAQFADGEKNVAGVRVL